MEIGSGLIGLIVLIADVWAIIEVFGSNISTGSKLMWILLILVLPVIGVLIWFFAGPRRQGLAA